MNRLFSLLVLLLYSLVSMSICLASERLFSSDVIKAVEAADSKLAEFKISQGAVEAISVKKHTTPSNEVVRETATDPYSLNLKTVLKNKIYWLVYYEPHSKGLGGDFAVFVEDKTWKVLGFYKGK
jgi:fatty-acid desaturase